MANTDTPFGFQLIGEEKEGLQKGNVDASNSVRIGIGDPVIGEADGYMGRAAAGSGVVIGGIVKAITDTDGKPLNYLPASTAGIVYYTRVKSKQFIVQCDSGTAVAIDSVFNTADLVVGNCDTNTGQSIYELDSDNIGTGQTVRIIGLADIVGNAWGEHAKVIVEFVESMWDSNATL